MFSCKYHEQTAAEQQQQQQPSAGAAPKVWLSHYNRREFSLHYKMYSLLFIGENPASFLLPSVSVRQSQPLEVKELPPWLTSLAATPSGEVSALALKAAALKVSLATVPASEVMTKRQFLKDETQKGTAAVGKVKCLLPRFCSQGVSFKVEPWANLLSLFASLSSLSEYRSIDFV